MHLDFRNLAKRYIQDIVPYQPGKPIEELERELGIKSAIKLASNENPLGASTKAIEAAQSALADAHIYPDGNCFLLKKALAYFLKVSMDMLTIGNGSENILETIIKSYLGRGDKAVISEYAFLTIPLLITSYGGIILSVPAKNYGHDIKQMVSMVDEATKIIFIVNPNNPTGTYVTQEALKFILDALPPHILVVVDEAYNEYIDAYYAANTLNFMHIYPNLIVTRTFSKAYGLAALRIGYAIASPDITDILNRARLPFNVNSIAAASARAALLDQEHIKNSIHVNKIGMDQLQSELKKMQIHYLPTMGNFITLDMKKNGQEVYQQLLHKGVIVRPLGPYNLPTHLRITVGTYEQNTRFLQALHEVMRKSLC